MPSAKPKSERNLRAELKRLKARLAESEATVKAIRSGDVDAIVVDGSNGSQIFSLQSSEDPYRIMAERMNEGAATMTAEGTLLFCNRRLAEMVGLSTERLLGSSFPALLREQDHPAVAELLRSAAKKDIRADSYLLRHDGSTLPVQLSLSSIPLEESGQGLCLVATDLCEQKRVQEQLVASAVELAQQAEELRHSQQALETQTFMLQCVLDSMVEGLVAADEQGKFILWNPAAGKIMGLGPTNLPSREWSAHYGLFLPDTVTPIQPGESPLERTLRGEVGTTEVFLRRAGLNQGLWLEATGSTLIDKDGVTRGGVLAFRDITRRKTDELEIRKLNEDLEERIAKRTEQLQATNHELEAFSYSISHDLRAPLRHIAGFSRILVNDFGPAMAVEAREHLQSIEDAVSRMGMMVDALLKMAVLRRKSLRLDHRDLNPIVDEVISMLQPERQGRSVEWRIARLPALDCDPILMAQVFQNLLGNALKYSRGRVNAVVEVDSIQQPDKPPIIFVRDNGAGFNMKYAEKLLGVFQRFHTESEFEGTGVGLATVHRIIQKHGGTIWAEAEPDHGATFYFALQMTEQIGTTPKATAVSRH
jgi:PAS domain S-box-containing protein